MCWKFPQHNSHKRWFSKEGSALIDGLMLLTRDGMWLVITNMSHYKSKFKPLLIPLARSRALSLSLALSPSLTCAQSPAQVSLFLLVAGFEVSCVTVTSQICHSVALIWIHLCISSASVALYIRHKQRRLFHSGNQNCPPVFAYTYLVLKLTRATLHKP